MSIEHVNTWSKVKEESFNNLSGRIIDKGMNKCKVSTVTFVLIFIVAVRSLLFVNNFHVYKIVFASMKKTKFNEADFAIKDFGIANDGNPFLSVDGNTWGRNPTKGKYWICLYFYNR